MAKHKFKLSDQWAEFERRVIPLNAPITQRQEMRRAFYAGAVTMMSMMKRIGDDDSIDEEKGSEILDQIDSELKQFLSRVGKDY